MFYNENINSYFERRTIPVAEKKSQAKDFTKFEDKQQALDAALAYIEKQYGKGAVMKLGDEAATANVDVIPTGCLSLDVALGVGGIPRGRIIEIYGPESSGKTTIALHLVAEVQKMGGIAGYIDAEHALDPIYAKTLAWTRQTYIFPSPMTENRLEIAETMVRSGAIDIVIIDSVAASFPEPKYREKWESPIWVSRQGL